MSPFYGRQSEVFYWLDVAVTATSLDSVARALDFSPRWLSEMLRNRTMHPRNIPVFVERLDALLHNWNGLDCSLAKQLIALRTAWAGGPEAFKTYSEAYVPLLKLACAGAKLEADKDPRNYATISLLLGIQAIYEGVEFENDVARRAKANKHALIHLQDAWKYGAERGLFSHYIRTRLKMQICAALYNPVQELICLDDRALETLRVQLKALNAPGTCDDVAEMAPRDPSPLWNGAVYCVALGEMSQAARFYNRYSQLAKSLKGERFPALEQFYAEKIVEKNAAEVGLHIK